MVGKGEALKAKFLVSLSNITRLKFKSSIFCVRKVGFRESSFKERRGWQGLKFYYIFM